MLRPLLILWLFMTSAFAAEGYTVGPRDQVHIEFFQEPEITRDVTVGEQGDISLPYIQKLDIDGLTTDEIAQKLTEAYAQFYRSPQISVSMVQYRSKPVEVVGAVKKSGTYYLDGPTTAREVLTEAGWLLADKASGEVRIHRADGSIEVLSISHLQSGETDPEVFGNDRVSVPEGQFIYVNGEVAKPGAILFNEGLTVSQALTRAGGPSPLARLRNAHILRDGERIAVNLKRILNGRDSDVTLQPGDQLFLKESPL